VSAIFLGLNVFFITLRAVVKARIAKNFGINDVAMMVAVVCPCGPQSLVCMTNRWF
jgi:hypothetical protein